MEDVVVELPAGLYGNPNLTPRCTTGEFAGGNCRQDSQVGVSRIALHNFCEPTACTLPVFNLVPVDPEREIARFGFAAPAFPVFIDVSVRTAGDYGVTAAVHSASGLEPLEAAETVFWGNPSDASHDALRMTITEGIMCSTPCEDPDGERPSELGPIAFMTNPSACEQWTIGVSVTSYQLPGEVFNRSAFLDPGPVDDCAGLPFAPTFEAQPTSKQAGAPTGLRTVLKIPQGSSPTTLSTSTMREARVTLPPGMAISSSAGEVLEACTDAQVHFHEELDARCPDASKLGTATVTSPALPHPLQGTLYQRSQGEKGHRFRLWLVSDDLGLHVKLPGEIYPDPQTGQLTAIFSDLPQVPVEEIDFEIFGGPMAPLKNPDSCGTYQTTYSFSPHSERPPVGGQSTMTIDEGCGQHGFDPQLQGGVTDPTAGAFSPFMIDLARQDFEQNLAGFEVTLPEGELAKLRGVPLCPDAQASEGVCPSDSRIGSVIAAAGAGPSPLWIPQPGKASTAVYLGGPYKGAPFSVVSVVPAQVGPFDLGNVVVRSALAVDPETGVATITTDPLPQFIEGVPVLYRRLHVLVDRPEFSLNPTDCKELAITSSVSSTAGAIAHPTARFQVDGCRRLGFKPKLAIRLKGGTKRGDYPALSATLKARRGDANLGRVSVALPHSEFLAQEHIGTICTRVQFAADRCPKGSVYGKAKAWTPLLDQPLEGPVYLRSSDHPLPDLVMDLKGQIEIAVAARIDSRHGGIRTTFESVPDAPVYKFVLRMKGGSKSLLTNSTDICHGRKRATVRMRAQNGRAFAARPALEVRC
ncbi:MAG TPA: hypothetical protein VFX35_00515 [Solirubrobacterales bacterium]|nr:hypothetical protein [Solirubrobacterales bacterium]